MKAPSRPIAPAAKERVTFWFDVTCPFCWQTSRWMKEVEQVRDIEVEWVPMSLSVLNEGRDLDPGYLALMDKAWGPARVFTAVKTEHPESVDALYTALGKRIHEESHALVPGSGQDLGELVRASLEEVGLEASYADVARGTEWDAALRDFHRGATEAVGDEVGTPVVKLGEVAFFGPVITRVPRGEEAGKLFDAAVQLSSFPYFFEIKRSRTESPQFG